MSFVHDIVRKGLTKKDQDILAHIEGGQRTSFTMGQLLQDLALCQHHLSQQNVQKGDKVCFLMPNSYQWVVLDLAILAMGAISVPLYHRQEDKDTTHILTEINPKLFVSDNQEVLSQMKTLCQGACRLEALFEATAQEPTLVLEPVEQKDIATIIYTSGSSGAPKGVMLSYRNIAFMLVQTKTRLLQAKHGSNRSDVVFHYLPLCFAGSRIMLWTQLHRLNAIDLSTDLQNLKEEISVSNPHYALHVPTVLERLRQGIEGAIQQKPAPIPSLFSYAKKLWALVSRGQANLWQKAVFYMLQAFVLDGIKKKIGTRLEFLISGSAPLHPETQSFFIMLGIHVYQVYGLTETTAIVTMDTPTSMRPGTVGLPIPGIEVKIDEDGELLTKGPHVFEGYFGQLQKTQEVMDQGYFRTGDLAKIDDEGRLIIQGRKKNVIIPSSGHNILPEPLEELLLNLNPDIEHACIVGHGQSRIGVVVSAKTPNVDPSMIDQFNAKQPHYKKLAFMICSEEPFSQENGLLTANQKLKRHVIEEVFASKIEQKLKEVS